MSDHFGTLCIKGLTSVWIAILTFWQGRNSAEELFFIRAKLNWNVVPSYMQLQVSSIWSMPWWRVVNRIYCLISKINHGFFFLEGANECVTNNGDCSHHCVDLKIGHRCECPLGFKLRSNNKTCEDVNECSMVGICSQFCFNKNGSYECQCDEGFELLPDKKTCKVKGNILLVIHFPKLQ